MCDRNVGAVGENGEMVKNKGFSYVDLFAGCGGLSLGFHRANGQAIFAVEKSPMAGETYFRNFISRDADFKEFTGKAPEEQIEDGLLVGPVSLLLEDDEIRASLATMRPDVVAGGPPCQGFSLAGRRNPDDMRNQLPWQFLEVVEISKPKVVVIENVVGMRHKFSGSSTTAFEDLQTALSETTPKYIVQGVEVNAMHYGAPQHRPRLMIIGVRSDVAKNLGLTASGKLWKSSFLDEVKDLPDLAPKPTTLSNQVRTVGDAISDLAGLRSTSESGKKFQQEMKDSDMWGLPQRTPRIAPNNNARAHSQTTQRRFSMYQLIQENGLDARLLSKVATLQAKEATELASTEGSKLRFPAVTRAGVVVAKDLDQFATQVIELSTKKHSQRVIPLDKPARTVVTIGDDYVHPLEPRVFSVRELARFQGFPDAFEFFSKETTGGKNRQHEVPQYSQVGNAVSPYMAFAVGSLITKILG